MEEKDFAALSPLAELHVLLLLAAEKGVLKRAVLSKPFASDRVRAILTVRRIGERSMLQSETFYADHKARHQNYEPTDATLRKELALYGQINLLTTLPNGDCEFKCSAGGKMTLMRGVKLFRMLCDVAVQQPVIATNDRSKQHILNGHEPFLHKLGVSDANGRVYDKKQSKFRQINRFLELLRDVEDQLPANGILHVCDLCCGKSYLSFAVYHYLTAIKGRQVIMECVDLKRDVMDECATIAARLGMDGLHFICGDVAAFDPADGAHVHLVVSLHACDTATDLVLNKAISWQSEVILSTPCCHHELNHSLDCPELSCIAAHSMLRQKLCDAATDAMRLLLLEAHGYTAAALELIDPDETPKNVMLRAVRKKKINALAIQQAKETYADAVRFFIRTEGSAQTAFLDRNI